jgi:hypothetical protein
MPAGRGISSTDETRFLGPRVEKTYDAIAIGAANATILDPIHPKDPREPTVTSSAGPNP